MNAPLRKNGGPVLDEATFQKLLSAAYVLQEHHDRNQQAEDVEAKADNPDSDSDTSILAQIVETQHEIQSNHLNLQSTAKLVVERILKISAAQGAAVGLVHEDELVYQAGSGVLSGQTNRSARREATLSASTLLHDMILRCTDAGNDFRVNPELTRRLGIGSLISVPVFHNGKTSGALELVFAKPDAFQDQDVRTCQLMAGLVTETLIRTAEEDWRKDLAAERASMLEVLEKIKPQLARLANTPDAALELSKAEQTGEISLAGDKCLNCGAELGPQETFCGSCGMSRASVSRNDLQSKWATLWNLKNAHEEAGGSALSPGEDAAAHSPGSEIWSGLQTQEFSAPEKFSAPEEQGMDASVKPVNDPEVTEVLAKPRTEDNVEPALSAGDQDGAEKSESRVWLRSIAVSPPAVQLRGFWKKHSGFIRTHRGDLALGGAFILFLITVLWAISSDHPTTSADSGDAARTAAAAPAKPKRKQAPAPPKLSMLDQFLVNIGLAEPPPSPSNNGNPDIPVWVDIHTALYYCPGSDLYGKTAQGKIASQRDAQMDQFEPASRKVCE